MDWVQSRPQGFNCASAHSSENAHHKPWFSFFVRRTEHFRLPLRGVNHTEWPKDEHENTPTETRRHLLPAKSRGHRTPPAQHQALTTRKETISDIWSSPVLKPSPETRSGQKTTTSTPNIISGRCPRTEGRHRKRDCFAAGCSQPLVARSCRLPMSALRSLTGAQCEFFAF